MDKYSLLDVRKLTKFQEMDKYIIDNLAISQTGLNWQNLTTEDKANLFLLFAKAISFNSNLVGITYSVHLAKNDTFKAKQKIRDLKKREEDRFAFSNVSLRLIERALHEEISNDDYVEVEALSLREKLHESRNAKALEGVDISEYRKGLEKMKRIYIPLDVEEYNHKQLIKKLLFDCEIENKKVKSLVRSMRTAGARGNSRQKTFNA